MGYMNLREASFSWMGMLRLENQRKSLLMTVPIFSNVIKEIMQMNTQ